MTMSICPLHTRYGDVNIAIEETTAGLSIVTETARLKIVSANTKVYEADLQALYGSKKVNELVGSGSTLPADQVSAKIERWIKRWSEHNPLSGYVVVKKDTGEFVGQIILKPLKDRSQKITSLVPGLFEIGYLSAEKHWGQKYGQEFTHAIVHHLVPCLREKGYLSSMSTLMATARPDNHASNKILETFLTFTGEGPRYGGPRMWYKHTYS